MGKINTPSELRDEYGYSTLDTIAEAEKFNQWMYSVIAPWCEGEILEIGGGIGNISKYVLEDKKNLTITELQEEYCEIIRQRLGSEKNLRKVIPMDIVDEQFDITYASLLNTFDTLFALNVIEHIADRPQAIQNCYKLLKPGGKLIILVPAFQSLFNQFDVSLGHFLRFRKNSLSLLLSQNGFTIIHKRYFNFIGILGWWFSGSVLGKKEIPKGQMRLYNTLVPVFRLVDFFTKSIAGLSVIAIGEKR